MRDNRWLTWGGALAIGLATTLWLMPLPAILGTGGLWGPITGDNAQSLSMHIAFQNDSWHLPPLFTRALFWPEGVAASMGDSNPLFSLIAKSIVSVTGGPAINLLGLWLACCWTLMALACVYAVRGLGGTSVAAGWAAACLGVLTPALLARLIHLNLMGHFLIVLALGVSFRLLHTHSTRLWAMAFAVLLVSVLTHPYTYLLSAAVLCAPLLHDLIATRRLNRRLLARTAIAIVLPVVLLVAASGTLGGGDKGFGKYSMNLLSMVVPQRSGLFGADLPIIDGTGGQYEGFAYLGAGVLFVLAVWLIARPWRGAAQWRGMIVVLAGLTLLAIGSQVYVGRVQVLNLGVKPWEDVFSVIRANGRAIWPVGYALMLAAVAGVSRRRAVIALPVLALAVGLQWLDTAPLRLEARDFFEGRGTPPLLPALPTGARVLSTAPAPGCTGSALGMAVNSPLLLKAARAGLNLGDVGLGRQPKWFNCEMFLSNDLEGPMQAGELRAFTDPQYWPDLRVGVFGNAACAETAGMVLCGAGVGPIEGRKLALAGPDSVPVLPGAQLADLLGFGWKTGGQGAIWSEGPRSTLRLRLAGDADQVVTLALTGIAFSPGGTRDVSVSVNGAKVVSMALPDLTATTLAIPVRHSLLVGGVAWIALDVNRPVDPARRALAAPVSRAALRLADVSVRPKP